MALEHITVLDLTHMLSGPYGTLLLTDLGARTIKSSQPAPARGRGACWSTIPTTRAPAWAPTSSRSIAASGASAST